MARGGRVYRNMGHVPFELRLAGLRFSWVSFSLMALFTIITLGVLNVNVGLGVIVGIVLAVILGAFVIIANRFDPTHSMNEQTVVAYAFKAWLHRNEMHTDV